MPKSKNICRIFLLFLFLAIASASVLADGMMMYYSDEDMMWGLLTEGKQFCAINYKEGYQNTILTITTDEELKGSEAVWIFPVPSDPEKTVINIVTGFPTLLGRELDGLYEESLSDSIKVMGATQIYTWPVLLLLSFGNSRMATGVQDLAKGTNDFGVTIYEHIEKYGLTTELVSIDDMDAFNHYLSLKGLTMDDSSKNIFSGYVGGEYSLVVSWISDVEEYKRQQENNSIDGRYMEYQKRNNVLGVSITFPTDKIYFPLKPTSVYGSKVIPAVVYVIGYAKPELFGDIAPYTDIEYYYDSRFWNRYNYNKDFYFNEKDIRELFYTKISIDAPSKYYTQDLWMDITKPSFDVSFKLFAVRNGFLHSLLLVLLSSFIVSVIAAAITFRNDSPTLWKFGLFGMLNTLTLFVFSLSAYIFRVDERFTALVKNNAVNQPVPLKRVLVKTSKIVGIICGIILLFAVFFVVADGLRYFDWNDARYILLPLLLVSLFSELLISPFVWGYYNNRRIMWYTISFAMIFLIMMIISLLLLS